MIGRLRRVLRIARWEASGVTDGIDRGTAAAALVLLLVAGTVVGAGLAAGVAGLDVDRDVYRVGVDAESPYAEAVADEPALTPVVTDRATAAGAGGGNGVATDGSASGSDGTGDAAGPTLGEHVDLLVVHGDADRVVVRAADSPKGEAAAATFREAVESHNERRMAAEGNRTAAFPVTVTLQYVGRTGGQTDEGTLGVADGDGADEGGDEADGTDEGGEAGSVTGGEARDDDADDDAGGDADDDLAVPSVGGGVFGAGSVGSPGSITPPFPFASLVLAFAFLVPMNFLIQAYGSSMLNERINRRGELLLVAPLAPVDVVAGKTLPYVAAAAAVTTVVALAVGGGVVSVLAVLPIAAAFLGATFVGAMFARSFKELTFVTVAVSVLLTTYAFVPAVFTDVTPVALISPLTLVVLDLQGEGVSLGAFLFSTGPVLLAAGLLFALGAGVYREEDLFTQKPVPRKLLDALAVRLRPLPPPGRSTLGPAEASGSSDARGSTDASGSSDAKGSTDASARTPNRRSWLRGFATVAVVTACTIPFVFVAELLLVAVLFALPVTVSIPTLLVTIAFVEEVAKSLHLYAGFERGVFARTDHVAIGVGLASGIGFFLAEKATAVVHAIGLTELYVGRAAFGAVAGLDSLPPALAIGLFLAPLALHGFATVVAAVGASRGRTYYALTLAAATAIHAAYNVGVVSLHG
ncbi:PrsW family intramembrane metalloprotease [Halorubrum sp. JWXQ-INN 858]|uniref:PrsW family intramembrane metalloprotease n=1 Tax=Halorubrum sp. JWXQ-INN 858 TaxID=2690782 RepID=UPI0013FA8608|nr:PrsW family intramembrane metalloprotease [Halorubrum sp. JWXQ-INN 858]MWV64941.1 PrsW family intramembrane metalloprotease [Halorubrum sp. JWXQ-INN 858]